jgi:hypothetical protein
MRKKLENRLTMYEGLMTLLQDNADKAQSVTGFAASVSDFGSVVDELKEKYIETERATAGKTSHKYDSEDALVDCLPGVCSVLYVYGRKQNNREIMERADISESRLRRMRDTDLASYGADIANMAEANSAGLTGLVLPEARIPDIKEKAAAYNAAIGSRESGVAERIGVNAALADLFDRADDIINDELDRYMELVRSDDPEFYNMYKAALVIKNTGVRHRPVAAPVV